MSSAVKTFVIVLDDNPFCVRGLQLKALSLIVCLVLGG